MIGLHKAGLCSKYYKDHTTAFGSLISKSTASLSIAHTHTHTHWNSVVTTSTSGKPVYPFGQKKDFIK